MTNITTELTAQIDAAKQRANAERAYDATGRLDDNPWAGSIAALMQLEKQRSEAESRQQGKSLVAQMVDVKAIGQELDLLQTRHTEAVKTLRQRAAHPSIARYLNGGQVAINHGVGHAWVLISEWILSGRDIRNSLPQIGAMKQPGWPAALSFTEDEMESIRQWRQSEVEVQRIDQSIHNANFRRERILSDYPVLRSIQ